MQVYREQRLPCQGRVNLIIDAAPWKLRTQAQAVNVSLSGICLRYDSDPNIRRNGGLNLDLLPLIREGHVYELQIENEDPEARSELTQVTLMRKQRIGESYLLGFRFASVPTEVSELLEQLADTNAQH